MNRALIFLLTASLAAASAVSAFAGVLEPLTQALPTRLSALPPLEQITLLGEQAASNSLARDVAAAVLRPELITLRQADFESRLGPDEAAMLAPLVAALHVEARGDERVMAGMDALARQIAPGGRVDQLDLGEWFDGGVEPAAPAGARLSAAQAWPLTADPAHDRRVLSLTARNGEFLVNGKRAERFRPRRKEGDFLTETLVSPNDNDELIKLYHSAGTFEGYERKAEKIEGLSLLSVAGAAPRMIEHGEAPVPGKGRVYFYVQERATGVLLRDLEPAARPLAQVRDLFARLARAGLSLVVADESWLMSHVMIGKTKSGGARAYLLDGEVEPASAEELNAHYQMLLSVIAAAPAQKNQAVSSAGRRLAASDDGDGKTLKIFAEPSKSIAGILARYRLKSSAKGKSSSVTLTLDGEAEALRVALALLEDSEVARIEAAPAVVGAIKRRSTRALIESLKLLPEGEKRDALILKIPAAAYAKMESADVAAIMTSVDRDALQASDRKGAKPIYDRLPPEAWQRLSPGDMANIAKCWLTSCTPFLTRTVARRWVEMRSGELVKNFQELLPFFSDDVRGDVLTALFPAMSKQATDQERAELERLLPGASPRVREIFSFGLNDKAQLNAIEKLLDDSKSLSARDLVYLLEKMPRGVGWGYTGQGNNANSRVNDFFVRMMKYGGGENWDRTSFLPIDVILLAKAIEKTQARREDAELLTRVPALVKAILKSSGATKSKKEAFVNDVESLMFQEFRQLSERLK